MSIARRSPARDPGHAITDVARLELSCGSVDALRAVRFASRFPPHFHDTFAIGVVESGATRIRTAAGTFDAAPGAILAFAPGEVHAAEPTTPDGYTFRMVYPSVEFMREIGIDGSAGAPGASCLRAPVIVDPLLGLQLRDAHRPAMLGGDRAAEAALVAALRRLFHEHRASRATGGGVRAAERATAERARAFLEARHAQRVRLDAVADDCGVSLGHLVRTFHRVVGVPPYAYLLQLRVNRALAMLGDGARLADVAYACGFADQSHLTRAFKRTLGVPPGQYARQTRARVA